jgi:hypothetical protein
MHLPESQQLPRGPIIQSFRTQIFERHEAARQADCLLREQILANLEQKRQTGLLIQQAKGTLRETEFREAIDFLSNQAVREYIRFSQHNPAPVTDDFQAAVHSIKAALRITNALPFTNRGPERLHTQNFFSAATTLIQNLCAQWGRFIRIHPLKNWRLEELESFVADLSPLERLIKTVAAELRHKEGRGAQ